MSANSSIEWTDRTWNPVRGCSRVSEGCRNCYAERIAARFSRSIDDIPGPRIGQTHDAFHGFAEPTPAGPRWTGRVELIDDKLREPLTWRTPARVFVNSMSDLFHENLLDDAIDKVFAVMALAPQHTFQVLTKRADRMHDYFAKLPGMQRLARIAYEAGMISGKVVLGQGGEIAWSATPSTRTIERDGSWQFPAWPLPNVWLGVSVEDQENADKRIPELLQTPAAVRFVSAEPLLGEVDLGLSSATCACCPRWASRWVSVPCMVIADFPMCLQPQFRNRFVRPGIHRATSNPHGALSVNGIGLRPSDFEALPSLDWVIVGGESGPGARPFDLEWGQSAVNQCRVANVPVFVKQFGAVPLVPACRQTHWDYRFVNRPEEKRFTAHDQKSWRMHLADSKGGDMSEWPKSLRVREFPRLQ